MMLNKNVKIQYFCLFQVAILIGILHGYVCVYLEMYNENPRYYFLYKKKGRKI